MKIHIQSKEIQNLTDRLERSYVPIYEELTNSRPIVTGYATADLMEIDKSELDVNIDTMISALKKIRYIKPFNPKKPL